MKRFPTVLALFLLFAIPLGVYAEIPGELRISSNPTGAAVFLDEKMIGHTPLTLPNVTPGRVRLKITLRGYQPWEEWVLIEAGRSLRVERTLEQRVGTVIVGSNAPDPEVFFRDRWIPATEIALSPGTYDLRFRAFGYATKQESVTVFHDEATIINLEFEKVSLSVPAVSVLQDRFHPRTPGVDGRARFLIEVDAPFTLYARVFDPEGVVVYESEEKIVRRVTTWEWDGVAGNDRIHPEGGYRVRFVIYDGVSRYTISRTIVLDVNAVVLPRVVSAYGLGSTLLTIPEVHGSRQFILDLGGGVRLGRHQSVRISLGVGVAPLKRMSVSGTITIPGEPENTPPVVGVAGSILYTIPVAAKYAQPAIRIGGAGATGAISGRTRTAVEAAVPLRLGVRGGHIGVLSEIGVGVYGDGATPENAGYHASLGVVRERPSYLLTAGMRYAGYDAETHRNVGYAGDIVVRPTDSPVFFRVTVETSDATTVVTFSTSIMQ